MKTILMFILLISGANFLAQQGFVVTGGNGASATGSISYTVGQLGYVPFIGGTTRVSPGVQQPFEVQVYLGVDVLDINLEMVVYPNPTSDVLNLSTGKRKFPVMEYALFDASGKLIKKEKLKAEITQILMQNFSSSIYILKVSENGSPLKSFKIIKK